MARIFAIGDIHGCSNTFKRLLLDKIKIRKSDIIYCLGDYVDRGIDSKGVIDFILELRAEGYTIYTLRGNHEQMMLEAPLSKEKWNHWIKNGGTQALKSFNITSLDDLPAKYRGFLESTELFIETDDFIFVHAGLNFNIENPFSDKVSMLWTRDAYMDSAKIKNKTIIHGHTPVSLVKMLNQPNKNNINIDGGCVFKNNKDFGYLVALSLTDCRFICLRNSELSDIDNNPL